MCGVFGVISANQGDNAPQRKVFEALMKYSESRGREASGIAAWSEDRIDVLKRPLPAHRFRKLPEFRKFMGAHFASDVNKPLLSFGHCRLVTDGESHLHENNQPVIDHGMVLVHNGIIVNAADIYLSDPALDRKHSVDSEVILDLIAREDANESLPIAAVRSAFGIVKGTATVALLRSGDASMILATNNGSMFYAFDEECSTLAFASEAFILRRAIERAGGWSEPEQLGSGSGLVVSPGERTVSAVPFALDGQPIPIEADRAVLALRDHVRDWKDPAPPSVPRIALKGSPKLLKYDESAVRSMRRCTRCVVPNTFPFIRFDTDGVCTLCRGYRKPEILGEPAFLDLFRTGAGRGKKAVLAFSGGRDSCFALDYLRKHDIPTVAYTYDWGVVTDLARRNMSRMCAQLGVEHILVSADLRQKRENIRKNVSAWLKQPSLGMIPLFMAGDKQFFTYAQKIKRQQDAEHIVFGINHLERTDFKVGFCGIQHRLQDRYYQLRKFDQLKLIAYYARQFVTNPSYLNASIPDTLTNYFSYYLSDHTYQIIYRYLDWNEDEINRVLIDEYGWETAPDTTSTWRIGDGTASFYNYIYFSGAGFTESDTFRSNQVREGLITRAEALERVVEENRPRYSSLQWYCDTIGLDFNETIARINQYYENAFTRAGELNVAV